MKLLALLLGMLPALQQAPMTLEGDVRLQGADGRKVEAQWRLAADAEQMQLVLISPSFDVPVAGIEASATEHSIWWQPPGKRRATRYSGSELPPELQRGLEHWTQQSALVTSQTSASTLAVGGQALPEEIRLRLEPACSGAPQGSAVIRVHSVHTGSAERLLLDTGRELPMQAVMDLQAVRDWQAAAPACP